MTSQKVQEDMYKTKDFSNAIVNNAKVLKKVHYYGLLWFHLGKINLNSKMEMYYSQLVPINNYDIQLSKGSLRGILSSFSGNERIGFVLYLIE